MFLEANAIQIQKVIFTGSQGLSFTLGALDVSTLLIYMAQYTKRPGISTLLVLALLTWKTDTSALPFVATSTILCMSITATYSQPLHHELLQNSLKLKSHSFTMLLNLNQELASILDAFNLNS